MYLNGEDTCRLMFTSLELVRVIKEYMAINETRLASVVSRAVQGRYLSVFRTCIPICKQSKTFLRNQHIADILIYSLCTSVNSNDFDVLRILCSEPNLFPFPIIMRNINHVFMHDLKMVALLIKSGAYQPEIQDVQIFIELANREYLNLCKYSMEEYHEIMDLVLSKMRIEEDVEIKRSGYDRCVDDSLNIFIKYGDLNMVKKIMSVGDFTCLRVYKAYREAMIERQEEIACFINSKQSSWTGYYAMHCDTQSKITDYFDPKAAKHGSKITHYFAPVNNE